MSPEAKIAALLARLKTLQSVQALDVEQRAAIRSAHRALRRARSPQAVSGDEPKPPPRELLNLFLPGIPIHLKARRPGVGWAPTNLRPLLRARRQELGISCAEAARRIGIPGSTYHNWETYLRRPHPASFAAVVRFLGREPWPTPITLGERLKAVRLRRGMTVEELAADIGLLPLAVYRAQTRERSSRRKREKIRAYVEAAEAELRADASVKMA